MKKRKKRKCLTTYEVESLRRSVSFLDNLRAALCAYGPASTRCDCKFGRPGSFPVISRTPQFWDILAKGGELRAGNGGVVEPAKDNSEATGCAELRVAAGALRRYIQEND